MSRASLLRIVVLLAVPEYIITPRHDPDENLFNFISHNSFLRLPLSQLQQCPREVRSPPCEIHIHLLFFLPHEIASCHLCVIYHGRQHIREISFVITLTLYN